MTHEKFVHKSVPLVHHVNKWHIQLMFGSGAKNCCILFGSGAKNVIMHYEAIARSLHGNNVRKLTDHIFVSEAVADWLA